MNRKSSITIILFVAGVLFTVGFACNDSGSSTTSNSTTTSSNTPAPATPKNIAGNYDATGTNINGGGTYKAALVVTPHDDVYQFSWNSGGKSYDGVGVMTDSSVAVSYTDGASGKGCGVVLYKIATDGSLDGKAGYWGVNKAEWEQARRLSGQDLQGFYEVSGKNPEGKEYKGKLAIKQSGETYTVAWEVGSEIMGDSIRQGDKFIASFGGERCNFVAYELKPDGTLEGRWGGWNRQGSMSLGTEVAKKK